MTTYSVVKTWANWDAVHHEVVASGFASPQRATEYAAFLDGKQEGGLKWAAFVVREDRERGPSECIWEDCDQDAIYCKGHALEYANVESENEAIQLRHTVQTMAQVLNRIVIESKDVQAAMAAESVLIEFNLPRDGFRKA